MSSSSGSNNMMGVNDMPKNGRERAIEALIDLDSRGPSFRVGRILNESPAALAAARPNKITKAALFDAAQLFSNFQFKNGEYIHHTYKPNISSRKNENEKSDEIEHKVDKSTSTSRILFGDGSRDPPSEIEKERVMKHHANIVMAKYLTLSSSATNIATKEDEVDKKQLNVPAVYPPPQLVAALRKMYGSPSSERLQELDENGISLVSSLVQSISDHPIFSSNIYKSETESNNDVRESISEDYNDAEGRGIYYESPIANLESIIGKACNPNSCNNEDFLFGILIAAFSVLTSLISDNDDSDELALFTQDDIHTTLQVAGPLSLHAEKYSKVSMSLENNEFSLKPFSNLIIDSVLMNYFFDAAAICEERDELKRANEIVLREQEAATTNNGEEDISFTPGADETESILHEPGTISSVDPDSNDDENDNSSVEHEHSSSTSSSDDVNEIIVQGNNDTGQIQQDLKNDRAEINSNDDNNEVHDTSSDHGDKVGLIHFSRDEIKVEDDNIALKENTKAKIFFSKNGKPLPPLPKYPAEEFQPEDIMSLNPTLQRFFGKLPLSSVLVNLLFIALEESEDHIDCKNRNNIHSSVHLMIAMLSIISNARNDSIKYLGELCQKRREMKGQSKGKDEYEGILEDDDPAFMMSSQVASAVTSSEFLEEKGLVRKAAAAAQSASIQRRKIDQTVGKVLDSVKSYSLYSFLILRMLRFCIQQNANENKFDTSNFSAATITRVRLMASLANFTSVSSSLDYHLIASSNTGQKTLDETFLPFSLLFEASSLWGEITPFMYSSTSDLDFQLDTLLRSCFSSSFDNRTNESNRVVFHSVSLPWSEFDVNILKLDSLCRRFRSADVIDRLVSSSRVCSSSMEIGGENVHSSSYPLLLAKISQEDFLSITPPHVQSNIKGLFLALHHRCNQNLLLWGQCDNSYREVPCFQLDKNHPPTVRNNAGSGDNKISLKTSTSFAFDSSRCSDSIALVPSKVGDLSAHQRASKVWGTVLSATSFEPKSGVHRWGVRLDKCDRGHIFVGVATSRTSTKTYVGGDKFSWGLIGTQALWHERRKVRSDYGETFRSGSIIVVTLDTDSGSLSFGVLHESMENTNEYITSESINISTSNQDGNDEEDVSGYVEDWGVAFEGLPLDVKLYPAIGLYQRDDKVTLLKVNSAQNGSCVHLAQNDIVYGSLYYPENSLPIQEWNTAVCNNGALFVESVINHAIERLESISRCQSDVFFFGAILPSVLASLALYPVSIPELSGRFCMVVLPMIKQSLLALENAIKDSSKSITPALKMRSGDWTIRAAPLKSYGFVQEECEEYIVDINQDQYNGTFKGLGIGTSGKSIDCKVSVMGAYNGSSIRFVEEWRDDSAEIIPTSSCVIDARLNLYGTGFEGTYKNVHHGKSGKIIGVLNGEHDAQEDNYTEDKLQQYLVLCSALLGTAIGHLTSFFDTGAPTIDAGFSFDKKDREMKSRVEEIEKLIPSSPILSNGLNVDMTNKAYITSSLQSLVTQIGQDDHKTEKMRSNAILFWKEQVSKSFNYDSHFDHDDRKEQPNESKIRSIDSFLAPQCGGFGSLSMLEPESYRASREKIISVLIYLTGSAAIISSDKDYGPELKHIWQTALKIMESGVRTFLFQLKDKGSRRMVCTQYCQHVDKVSDFLMKINPEVMSTHNVIDCLEEIYLLLPSEEDLTFLMGIMESRKRRQFLQYFGVCYVQSCLEHTNLTDAFVESIISSWSFNTRQTNTTQSLVKVETSSQERRIKSLQELMYNVEYEIIDRLSSIVVGRLDEMSNYDFSDNRVGIQSLSIAILENLFFVTTCYPGAVKSNAFWSFVKTLISFKGSEFVLEKHILIEATTSETLITSILLNVLRSQTWSLASMYATTIAHVALFLLLNCGDSSEGDVETSCCLPASIIINKISETIECIKRECVVKSEQALSLNAFHDGSSWIKSSDTRSDYSLIQVEEQTLSIGVAYIITNAISLKESEGPYMSKSLDDIILAYNSSEKYMNLLIDTLFTMTRSNFYPDFLKHDSELIMNLCKTVTESTSKCTIPAHFRIRILRLLRHMITKSSVDIHYVALNFLKCIGEKLSLADFQQCFLDTPEKECYIEVKEMISLLRSISIDECSESIENTQLQDLFDSVLCEKSLHNQSIIRGVQAFYGSIPDKVVEGSCVLLNSSGASHLSSASSQHSLKTSSNVSRPKGTIGNTTTITAFSGAKAIVSGLQRNDVLAGRISEINIAKGTCEVVLFDRLLELDQHIDRHLINSMSVRVIKVPFRDVVVAEELPMIVNTYPSRVMEMISSTFEKSLDNTIKLIEKMDSIESLQEVHVDQIFDTLLSLRMGTVLFSSFDFIKKFLKDDNIEKKAELGLMNKLLSLASFTSVSLDNSYMNSACGESLSSLPEYQGRYWTLRGLLIETEQRKTSFGSISLNKLCRIRKNSDIGPSKATAANIDISNETVHDTPFSILQDIENRSSTNGGNQQSTYRQGSRTDTSEFNANSVETMNDDDDEENEEEESSSRLAENAEAADLREAAIMQMAELGLPRSWSEYALRRVGGIDIEAAVHFCLERGADMERLLLEERERSRRSTSSSTRRRAGATNTSTSHLLRQLVEMGFPPNWCAEALLSTGHNVDEALTWMIRNSERLSAQDEGVDDNEVEDDEFDEEDSADDNEEGKVEDDLMQQVKNEADFSLDEWPSDIVCPLRSISGKADIDQKTLVVKGLPTGGFSSVGMKGISLESGKWYYEAELLTDGCLQIGWADSSFSGHCHADRGDGCGDGPSSWAFDGWRRYRWHCSATEFGCKWQVGDVIGCLLDMDTHEMRFTLNGQAEEIGMGLAFSGDGFRPCGGVFPCVSFNRKEKVRLILGNGSTKAFHSLPPGYRGVSEVLYNLIDERNELIEIEDKVHNKTNTFSPRRSYLCDFSYGEHGHELFSWQHRYHGADASVHLGGRKNKSNKRRKLDIQSPSNCTNMDELYHATIDSRLLKALERKDFKARNDSITLNSMQAEIERAYALVERDLLEEIKDICFAMCILYARKMILHLIITMSSDFNINIFHHNETFEDSLIAKKLWVVVEKCCSLHKTEWIGEAGAMNVAAEALGIAISSSDRSYYHSAFFSFLEMNTNKIVKGSQDESLIPMTASTQILTSAKLTNKKKKVLIDPTKTFAACAESALGVDEGGSIIFLIKGLQNAIIHSSALRQLLMGVVRRSVRLLSSVEFRDDLPNVNDSEHDDDDDEDNDDGDDDDNSGSDTTEMKESVIIEDAPDARLISFLTGLLLSTTVSKPNSRQNELETHFVAESLFLSWSIGLLSQSAPWRMICAMTVSSILDLFPKSHVALPPSQNTIRKFYSRLYSTVSRRIWAERSSVPICSLYVQSFVNLLSSMRKADYDCDPGISDEKVDSATPIPLDLKLKLPSLETHVHHSWEWDEGWVSCDAGWEVWTGFIEYHEVDWIPPSRSVVRSLTDGGEGPPMLREGCTVIRGLDWNDDNSGAVTGNEDGKDLYEKEKLIKDVETNNDNQNTGSEAASMKSQSKSHKLPIGKVISIEAWKGIPGLARRVKWSLTGEEGLYRYGGDGGRYDISHIEVNEKSTRIRKRYPLPESQEQCAARYGFGKNRKFSALLRCHQRIDSIVQGDGEKEIYHKGILELPDFGAEILVDCIFYNDGAVAITEKRLLVGSKDSGWEPRFGQPSYIAGTTVVLTTTNTNLTEDTTHFTELLGSTSYTVHNLRNRADGTKLRVTSEMRLWRSSQTPSSINKNLVTYPLPPIRFDEEFHASSLTLSRDRRTVTCADQGRCTAFGSVGFTKGVHYWEVKIEQADIGSVFIGVAEKPSIDSNSSLSDEQNRLNRWLGWGFVNFRATYSAGSERVYGAHFHSGDTIGVLLDCDAGRVSFFFDGVKYGEHIMNDLGCAYENISPFGFNADGCGSSGAAQGAPNGFSNGHGSGRFPSNGSAQPRTMWPVVGMRHPGDRVTFSGKWMTNKGVDANVMLDNALKVDEILCCYEHSNKSLNTIDLPQKFVEDSLNEFQLWREGRWLRSPTRGSGLHSLASYGLDADIDTSPLSCAIACASLGLKFTLLPGDRVQVKRSAGRLLELAEEAKILGAHQGRLWYQIVSQKSEGGSLSEGGGRSWFWDESEVVGDSLRLVTNIKAEGIDLPLLEKFKFDEKDSLKVVYAGGAVVRSDLEIFEGSETIGSIPEGTVIPGKDVLERRMNSCGVIRLLVKCEAIGQGWISSRIRGGNEEAIVEYIVDDVRSQDGVNDKRYHFPIDSANAWLVDYKTQVESFQDDSWKDVWSFTGMEDFCNCLNQGIISGLAPLESDSLLTLFMSSISDLSPSGEPLGSTFEVTASLLFYSAKSLNLLHQDDVHLRFYNDFYSKSFEVAARIFSNVKTSLPPLKCLLARIAMIRALNRRMRYALPWLSGQPPQEHSAILGGTAGLGASIHRCGKSNETKQASQWLQSSSTGKRIRICRSILFGSLKREYLKRIIDSTITPTPLSHDEYELPKEVRTVRVNRVKARHIMSSSDTTQKKKSSVFSQLRNEMRGWSGTAFRRGHVAKGHGGQQRAFKVKLIGEGVNDYSGPYREVFTDSMREITSLEADKMKGSLGVLEPSPNQIVDIGENRSLFVFSFPPPSKTSIVHNVEVSEEESMLRQYFSTLLIGETESMKDTEDSLLFLGKLASTAVRHGILVDLPLPLESVWKVLCEEKSDPHKSLEEVDVLASRYYKDYVEIPFLVQQKRMLDAFAEGISTVMPLEVFSIFTGSELRDFYCGNSDIDVDLLQKIVEYEGYKEDDQIIQYFWEVLKEMTSAERKLFLQFVWARSRLPLKESDFEDPFKIQKDTKTKGDETNMALPSASTCFFILTLPEYQSKEILKAKLLFAINNVTTMESDYVTNDSEVQEGWRGIEM